MERDHAAGPRVSLQLKSSSIFVYSTILLTLTVLWPLSISPILLERNVVVAIIIVGLTAASESGGHKGNKTREIRGQLPVVKVN